MGFVTSMLPPPRTPDKRGYSGARGLEPPDEQVLPGAFHFGFNDDFGFALVDRARPEGLAFNFGDGDFGLRPRQQSLTGGARLLLR